MNVYNWSSNAVAITLNGESTSLPAGARYEGGFGVVVTVAGGAAHEDGFAHTLTLVNDDSGVSVISAPGPGY